MIYNVAFYARVSTEKQNENKTIDSQIAALKNKAASDGYSIDQLKAYIDDGYSGCNLMRPALEKMRDSIMMKNIDKIYIHSPDRLARKYAHQVILLEEFKQANVSVEFLNCEFTENPESQLLLQMQGMIAEYERTKIIERNRRGKLHAAKKNSINVLGGAPYEYYYINKHDGQGKANYLVNKKEAAVVKKIYEWYALDKLSLYQIARTLEKLNYRTHKNHTVWDPGVISGILKNTAYIGKAAFGKSKSVMPSRTPKLRKGKNLFPKRLRSVEKTNPENWIYIDVPRVINDELFYQVQLQLEENKKRMRRRKTGITHLLQGILICEHCEYALYGKMAYDKCGARKTDYGYYRCSSTDTCRLKGRAKCKNKMIRSDILENSVWSQVVNLLKNPDIIRREYDRRVEE